MCVSLLHLSKCVHALLFYMYVLNVMIVIIKKKQGTVLHAFHVHVTMHILLNTKRDKQ